MTRKQKRNLCRIIVSAVLFAAATIISHIFELNRFVLLAIYLVPYFVVGYDVVIGAVRNLFGGQMLDEKFLMTIATVGVFVQGKEYGEGTMVMLLYQVGELFQSIAVGKSRKSIASLMDIRPDRATVVRDGKETEVSPEEVAVGETIVIRPGEKVPLDGTVIEGDTTLNTAALTGESAPRSASVGDKIASGSVNLTGVIYVKTESVFAESTVSKILELVENASEKKAKAENFITKFARYYTPIVVIGALVLVVIPPIFDGKWSEWIGRALIFLVVSCPCALVISVPLSFFGGIGGASRKGILIKGAAYLEQMSDVKTIVFDKTGTLTKGSFSVTAIHPESISEGDLLDIAAAAESHSTHPIAESIVSAHGGHINDERVGKITELSGLGIEAVIDGETVYVGNGKLMDKAGAKWHDCHNVGTIIHISKGSEYLGHIVISDEVKPDSKQAIHDIKACGVKKTVMLTGDRRAVGEYIANKLGIDEVHCELMPKDKVDEVEKLFDFKEKLAFVGDGINDAPVLMRADVGIAMGALGSDAAIEAADIVLMDDKPSNIAKAIKISRKTMRIVKENIVFALAVKVLVLLLTAVGYTNMWVAIFADVGVMVLAILNAMRCMRIK